MFKSKLHTGYKAFFFLFFCCCLITANAQVTVNYKLQLLTTAEPADFVIDKLGFKKDKLDSLAVFSEVRRVVTQLRAEAFLEASVDSLFFKDSLVYAFVHVGPQYEWAQLSDGNVGELWLNQVGFRGKNYRNKRFSISETTRLLDDLLTFAENHGYPFARVRLDSVRAEGGTIKAQLYLEQNAYIQLEKIIVKGDANISEQYLTFYLGLQQGQPYDKAKILQIKSRIQELPFLRLKKDPYVTFLNGYATIHLELEKKNASRFDFLIGVLPNNRQPGRVLITGNLEAAFHNQFGKAEQVYLQFEQLRPQTQQVEVAFNYPYILKLPFGADLNFQLYRRDTNFIDVKYEAGAQYFFTGNNYVKAFGGRHISNLLSVDTAKIASTGQLPDTLDISRTNFGLEYALEKLDYRFNPRRGFVSRLRLSAGIRELRRNNLIQNAGLGELYDALDGRAFQYRFEGHAAYYLPIGQTGALKTGVKAAFLLSDEKLLSNEQYRIGGNRLLRGFDEESVFATNYVVTTLEYRLLLNRNGYLYVFGDLARVDEETVLNDEDTVSLPYGFGAGITFETRAGVFGISLAYGSRKGNPIDFGEPKVHFGFVSLF
jgi:outer membrane protein assembly factor BamA